MKCWNMPVAAQKNSYTFDVSAEFLIGLKKKERNKLNNVFGR